MPDPELDAAKVEEPHNLGVVTMAPPALGMVKPGSLSEIESPMRRTEFIDQVMEVEPAAARVGAQTENMELMNAGVSRKISLEDPMATGVMSVAEAKTAATILEVSSLPWAVPGVVMPDAMVTVHSEPAGRVATAA